MSASNAEETMKKVFPSKIFSLNFDLTDKLMSHSIIVKIIFKVKADLRKIQASNNM